MTPTVLLGLVAAAGCCFGIVLGTLHQARETRWQKTRAAYWKNVAKARELPSFHHHPLCEATRYWTVDELMPRVVRVEGEC